MRPPVHTAPPGTAGSPGSGTTFRRIPGPLAVYEPVGVPVLGGCTPDHWDSMTYAAAICFRGLGPGRYAAIAARLEGGAPAGWGVSQRSGDLTFSVELVHLGRVHRFVFLALEWTGRTPEAARAALVAHLKRDDLLYMYRPRGDGGGLDQPLVLQAAFGASVGG